MKCFPKPLVFLNLLLCTSCTLFTANKGVTVRFDITYKDEKVDKESLDDYLTNNASSYAELKRNKPDILEQIKVIDSSGNDFKNNIKMFRFSTHENGFLDGATFLQANDTYYPLGSSFGGFGVTEFIRRQGDSGFWLYFIYSYGSGIHRTDVRAMNYPKGEFYTIDGLDLGLSIDYTFEINKEDNTIDLYKADIKTTYDEGHFDHFTITKKSLAFAKIDNMPKTLVE